MAGRDGSSAEYRRAKGWHARVLRKLGERRAKGRHARVLRNMGGAGREAVRAKGRHSRLLRNMAGREASECADLGQKGRHAMKLRNMRRGGKQCRVQTGEREARNGVAEQGGAGSSAECRVQSAGGRKGGTQIRKGAPRTSALSHQRCDESRVSGASSHLGHERRCFLLQP